MNDSREIVETLNARYVAAIDDDRLEDWPKFFTDPCRYEIISAETVEQGLPLGVFFADGHAMLNDRVQSLRRANIYESQRYRHVVSSTLILGEDRNIVRAQMNFLVVRIMLDGDMRLFMSGRYLDTIDTSGAAPLFAEKRVIFDNRRIDTLLALPI
jgi:anthranilate 1,2-dioxygenase small subunit